MKVSKRHRFIIIVPKTGLLKLLKFKLTNFNHQTSLDYYFEYRTANSETKKNGKKKEKWPTRKKDTIFITRSTGPITRSCLREPVASPVAGMILACT